jgi:hypothetical protein
MTLPPDPRTTYDGTDPVEDAPLAHKHALTRAVKRVVELSALLDVDAVPDATVEDLTAAIEAIADRLVPLPSLLAKGGLASCGGHQGALLERSGISGRSNPLAAPVQWVMGDDGVTRGWATYSAAYEGPAGSLHGGFVAAAFDDLLGSAQTASGSAGYTGTLTVRMRKPTPLDERIDYAAGVDRVEGRKIWVWGTADCAGVRLAEAEILFISPREGRPR